MFFSADFLNLIFYCVQQLGITLGVGAETIMLAAYLISMRDGVVDEKETQYARAITRVMSVALWLIILSGLGITALHFMAGESATVFASAFLFKWMLVALAVGLTFLRRVSKLSVVEGVIGGTWYALFLVHILAPVTTWFNLGTLYAVWLVGFVLCWEAIVVMRRDKKGIVVKKPAPVAISQSGTGTFLPKSTPPPKPAVILVPDLPRTVYSAAAPAPLPPPLIPPIPKDFAPVPAAPEPVSVPKDFIPPRETKITLGPSAPVPTSPASPGIKVTDTPFLPKVPALQPITVASGVDIVSLPATPTMPTPSPEAKSVITTLPGGTSAMALNVMPKNPAELEAKHTAI